MSDEEFSRMTARVLTPEEAAKEIYEELQEMRRRIAAAIEMYENEHFNAAEAANGMVAILRGPREV
jgi:hypothetical protein